MCWWQRILEWDRVLLKSVEGAVNLITLGTKENVWHDVDKGYLMPDDYASSDKSGICQMITFLVPSNPLHYIRLRWPLGVNVNIQCER